jgi:hypothetical protein
LFGNLKIMAKHWLLPLALLCVSSLGMAAGTGTLAGVVRDPAGAVMANEVVILACWGGDQRERHLYTDAEGEFSIALPTGVCDVFFSHGWFEPVAKSVKIEAGKKVFLKVDTRWRKGLKGGVE